MAESPPSVSTPEHPRWMPWWVRYGEYDGRCAVLHDRASPAVPEEHTQYQQEKVKRGRYSVTLGGLPTPCPSCLALGWTALKELHETDSLDEALAAFAEAERVLLGRQS